jgi:hypothetical protein
MNDKVTVGKVATDLMQKGLEQVNPIEYQREIHKNYEQEIYECVARGIKKYDGDFFVVVLYKRERALLNVYRAYYFPRQSCPTPSYDQTVYKYHRKDRLIELLWVMPDLETATVFQNHALEVVPEERGLLNFVLDFYDGTLDKLAQNLNNEGVIWTN